MGERQRGGAVVKRFDKHMHVLVTSSEYAMLRRLAKADGLTPSAALRQLIRKASVKRKLWPSPHWAPKMKRAS